MIKKKNIFNVFLLFLLFHLVIWTLIPTISNVNLPLDTIEALAWGSDLKWGFNKHPPLSAVTVELMYIFFGKQDWAYYLLSQICVVIAFIYVWKFANEIFEDKIYSLISLFLLEGIYFFNFTTPEFNVNVCQLPFWALTVYYFWKSLNTNKNLDWLLFSIFSTLGFLSKYLFIYLLISLFIYFFYNYEKNRKLIFKYFISIFISLLILTPHFYWLIDNNFITIFYGLNRTGLLESNFIDHIINPFIFIIKQIGILFPVLLMLTVLLKKFKTNINLQNKKIFFLIFINIIPLLLIVLTSVISGTKIRTMWMTPFYLFFGLLFIYYYKNNINLNFLKKFMFSFLFIFLLSPAAYLYISISKDNKRTDYPGKEIAYLIQNRWDKNFTNNIAIIVGDEWVAGNLSYHLQNRPLWFNNLEPKLKDLKLNGGVIYVGNADVLKSVCPGEFGSIKKQGICMIGSR